MVSVGISHLSNVALRIATTSNEANATTSLEFRHKRPKSNHAGMAPSPLITGAAVDENLVFNNTDKHNWAEQVSDRRRISFGVKSRRSLPRRKSESDGQVRFLSSSLDYKTYQSLNNLCWRRHGL